MAGLLLFFLASVSSTEAALVLSANNDPVGPITVNVGDTVYLEVNASGCENVQGNNGAWRDTWVNAGDPEQQVFGSSPCSIPAFGRTVSYASPGTFTIEFVSEYCRNYRFGDCRTGWTEDQRDAIVVIVLDPQALTCFDDDYSANGLDPEDWVTSVSSGSFTPTEVNGRLWMTEARANQSTAATLQREIPGAENLVILQFDYYAYGGNGADGIAVVLSDALITPRPGSFGGSLGYAQRNNGDAGFAGGWLGIGIDEYGNFSSATEGRQGGPGRTPDSVSVRGSGSGSSGYRYLDGTRRLNPGIDAT
ncbi:MAG: MshQ-like protein, partial [Marinobacter sp.]|nr:MshQ-like protein [Marinobacter sp.]